MAPMHPTQIPQNVIDRIVTRRGRPVTASMSLLIDTLRAHAA